MKNIQLLNKIAKCGTDIFDKDIYNVADTVENPDAIMVRSAVMHDMEFGETSRQSPEPVRVSTTFRLTSVRNRGS